MRLLRLFAITQPFIPQKDKIVDKALYKATEIATKTKK